MGRSNYLFSFSDSSALYHGFLKKFLSLACSFRLISVRSLPFLKAGKSWAINKKFAWLSHTYHARNISMAFGKRTVFSCSVFSSNLNKPLDLAAWNNVFMAVVKNSVQSFFCMLNVYRFDVLQPVLSLGLCLLLKWGKVYIIMPKVQRTHTQPRVPLVQGDLRNKQSAEYFSTFSFSSERL